MKYALIIYDDNGIEVHFSTHEVPPSVDPDDYLIEQLHNKRIRDLLFQYHSIKFSEMKNSVPAGDAALLYFAAEFEKPEVMAEIRKMGVTQRQLTILILRLKGNSVAQAAKHAHITKPTTHKHIENLYSRLHLETHSVIAAANCIYAHLHQR